MKLYRHYRHKKFGEPLEVDSGFDGDDFGLGNGQYIPQRLQDQEHLIYKKIEELRKALGNDKKNPDCAISDLHTVKEDYDDE